MTAHLLQTGMKDRSLQPHIRGLTPLLASCDGNCIEVATLSQFWPCTYSPGQHVMTPSFCDYSIPMAAKYILKCKCETLMGILHR